jgi:competence protein ComEA
MKLTADETRALAFIGLLIVLSIGARLLDRPEPIVLDAAGVDVAALEAASRDAVKRKANPEPRLGPGERIDPNTAPLEELRRLPRATRALAERIIEDRQRNGGFRTVQDLDRVRGIGPATLEAWSEHLTLPAAPVTSGASVSSPPTGARNAVEPSNGGPPSTGSRTRAGATPLDLNRATAEELERLPGIGAVLAERIVAYRDSKGGFRSVEELEQVRGVGPAMLAKLKPMVRLGT